MTHSLSVPSPAAADVSYRAYTRGVLVSASDARLRQYLSLLPEYLPHPPDRAAVLAGAAALLIDKASALMLFGDDGPDRAAALVAIDRAGLLLADIPR